MAVVQGGFLRIKLPSGRVINYPKVHLTENRFGGESVGYYTVDSQTKAFIRTETYGGKITENIIQSISADILREAIFTLDAAGYPIIMLIHDEIVAETPDNQDYNVLEMSEMMCRKTKQWMQGIPLSAEGWEGYRYKK